MNNALDGSRRRGSLGRLWIVVAAIAIGAGTEAAAQVADIISIRSTGRPPPELESKVAALSVRTPQMVQANETPGGLIKRICGYESADLAKMVAAENLAAFVGGKAQEDATVRVPACVFAVLSSEYVTIENDSPYKISRDKMGFGLDAGTRRIREPASRRTTPEDRLFDEFCTLNAGVPAIAASCSGRDFILPKGRKLVLPARAVSTDFKLLPPDGPLDEAATARHYAQAAEQIRRAAESVGSAPFLLVGKEIEPRALRQRPRRPDSCSTAFSAFDAARIFDLWQAYSPSHPVVLTVMDSGLASGSVLDRFVFAPDNFGVRGAPDSNNAVDAVSTDPVQRTSGPYGAFPDCDHLSSDYAFCKLEWDLAGFHGTHVAGLALGGHGFIDRLGSQPLPGKLLSLRIFRDLAQVPGSELFSYTPQALTNGFNWAQALPEFPLNVVNFSIGIGQPIEGVTPAEIALNRILFVASAGNDGKELRPMANNSDPALVSYYPALLGGKNSGYFITVGNASRDGKPHATSNKSKEFVDLFAVGECQSSFDYDGRVRIETGTSQAAPLVSFTAALLRTMHPSFGDPAVVKNRLVDTSDFSKALASTSWSGGLLNILQAIDLRADYVTYLEPGATAARTIRGIISDDNPALCDNLRPAEFSKFHRMGGTDDAKYRTRTSSKGKVFSLESCSIPADVETKMLRMRTFTQTKVEPKEIPISQIRSIIGRYALPPDDNFMKKTSVDP